ncbi:sigma 54-interacting transcriptional regulator [Geobacter sp. FeAm09]|uniref:sigma 54-interacting transcriptional regulator n=1 Tax=Geobacter sp. FeAm09 TaxID=2597769 RepID=UPI001F0DF0B2|nr:sigma 54-interacting transcriptional regulator [Geobacter sp. FeAm09]
MFLDEISELPLQSQVRLLRVLQSRMISRVGGEKAIPVDVRIIAATNRDLKQLVSDGRFREDLWFRLNIFPITIPPLRQRKEDIPALLHHFVKQKSRELGSPEPLIIAPGVYDLLMNHTWPGNVRELENLVERALITHQGGQLRFGCLLLEHGCLQSTAPVAPPESPSRFLNLNEAMLRHITDALKLPTVKFMAPLVRRSCSASTPVRCGDG